MPIRYFVIASFGAFAAVVLFCLQVRGSRTQAATCKVSGEVTGGPLVLESRTGGNLVISLHGSKAKGDVRPGVIIDREVGARSSYSTSC